MPDVTSNATDYGYHNPLPGSAGEPSVLGTIPDNVVVALGAQQTRYDAAALDANPVTSYDVPTGAPFHDLVTSPTEADTFDLNPAFKVT